MTNSVATCEDGSIEYYKVWLFSGKITTFDNQKSALEFLKNDKNAKKSWGIEFCKERDGVSVLPSDLRGA